MQGIRTICCKLTPTAEQAAQIDATLQAFADACNYLADLARTTNTRGRYALHRLGYHEVRARFHLSANLAVCAIARANAALQVQGKEHSTFDPTSVSYDARIFSFHEADCAFGLTLLGGRVRISTHLGDFQRQALTGQHPTSATLVKRGGRYYLHVQVKEQTSEPPPALAFLGVDLGIARIATDSTGESFSGQAVDRNRRRRATARKQYQRRGTKSAKRRLRKMAGKQARYQRWMNHQISKRLVAKAKALGSGIALEDLQGVRGRCEQTAGKSLRRRLGNWSFYQLRTFTEYKALRAGVPVVLVDPRYTSQTCSACGHREKANRRSQAVFCCKHCGHSMNADENAALNISAWAAPVNRPQKSRVQAQGQSPRL